MHRARIGKLFGAAFATASICSLASLGGCSKPAEQAADPAAPPPSAAAPSPTEEPQFSDGFESQSTDEWSKTTEPEDEEGEKDGAAEGSQ